MGLASVILAGGAGGTFAVGCSGDDNVVAPKDAGKDVTSQPDTGGNPDTGVDSGADTSTPVDANPPPKHAKIIVVHAGPNVPAIRLCFATGQAADGSDGKVSPLPALPHFALPGQPYAGLFPGTGGPLPDITDLSPTVITGYVVIASKIAAENGEAGAEKTCDQLLGQTGTGGTLTPNVDYLKLAPIPKGTFATGTTQLIAAVGCLPFALDPQANPIRCGSDWLPATGNVSAKIFGLDTVVADATKAGAQVVHASSAFEGYVNAGAGPDAGLVQVTAFVDTSNGATLSVVNGPPAGIKYGQKLPVPAAPQAAATIAATNAFGINAVGPDGGSAGKFGLPLGIIAKLTNGVGTAADGGAYFAVGENYTFVIMGDPTAEQLVADGGPNPNYNGYGLHIIAFPNNVVPPKFQ